MNELIPETIESSELVEETFNYWFIDHDHIRSPFPKYIHDDLKEKSTERFFKWTSGLDEKASKEVNDVIVGEKFEEIIFETALKLVLTEDEKLTVSYPFMPRVGDSISGENVEDKTQGKIIDRSVHTSKDRIYMKLKVENENDQSTWETEFDLPG